ncbi:MAG: AAA family ATPase [bacterium]|nr:AAA family ATPase [bacterium]
MNEAPNALLPVCRVAEIEAIDGRAQWLIEPLWGRTAVGFVAGAPKLGKTWLALDLALSVASDTACLGRFPIVESGPVLVYLAEDHPAHLRQRLEGMCRHRGLDLGDVPIHVITAPSLRLDLDRDRHRLTATVQAIQPRLVVLDPLVRLHQRDENQSSEIAELLAYLRELERSHEVAIVVVHHMRKNGAARAGQALRGSGDLHAWTDSALYLTARHDRVVLTTEHRAAPTPANIEIHLVTGDDSANAHLEIIDEGASLSLPSIQESKPTLETRVLAELQKASRPLPRFELRRALRVNNARLGEVLTDLEHRSAIQRDSKGAWQCDKSAGAS